MNCPRCRTSVPDIATSCQACGYRMVPSTPTYAGGPRRPFRSQPPRASKSSGSRTAVVVGSLGIIAVITVGCLLFLLSRVARMNRLEVARRTATATQATSSPGASGTGSQNSFTAAQAPNSSSSVAAPDTRPFVLSSPRPNYTEDARRHKVQGLIKAQALVGKDGLVKDVRLETHLPDGLDEQAIIAVKQMRFRPATSRGQPVNFWVTLEVEFTLR